MSAQRPQRKSFEQVYAAQAAAAASTMGKCEVVWMRAGPDYPMSEVTVRVIVCHGTLRAQRCGKEREKADVYRILLESGEFRTIPMRPAHCSTMRLFIIALL